MGNVEVFYGPMFDGKTANLVARMQHVIKTGKGLPVVYRPIVEDGDGNFIKTRLGDVRRFATRVSCEDPYEIIRDLVDRESRRIRKHGLVTIDEAHFLKPKQFVEVVQELRQEYDVAVATLDMDSKRVPFEVFELLSGLEGVVLTRSGRAWCHPCERRGVFVPARFTQKHNPDGTIESLNSDRFQPKYEYGGNGKKSYYEAVCDDCYVQPV